MRSGILRSGIVRSGTVRSGTVRCSRSDFQEWVGVELSGIVWIGTFMPLVW